MKLIRLLSFFLIFSIFFSNSVLAKREFNVGVSPSVVELGDVEAGTTELVNFFIITPSEETILVELQPYRSSLDFFNKAIYKDLIHNFSEEDVSPWVKIIENPVELKPDNETLETKGGLIKGTREVSFLLEIPKNADPGQHVVNIRPIPKTPSEDVGEVGTRVVAITVVNVLFNVEGPAKREATVLDVETGKHIGDRVEVKTYVKNSGTTTISAKAIQSFYDDQGEFIDEIPSGMEYLGPGEIKTLKSYLKTSGLSLGEYFVQTIVDYTTGTAGLNNTILLEEAAPASIQEEQVLIPIWLILLILMLLILIVIYRRMK